MSDAVNPYQSPESQAVPVKPLLAQGNLTETMLVYLKGASPWLRFMGILGFIGAGLTVVFGFSLFVIAPLRFGQYWDDIPGFESFSDIFGATLGGGMTLFCIGLGAIVFFPALFMYRFGERIRSYLRTGLDQELEQAFKNNKSLWKFIGIFFIIQLAFLPIVIVGGIFAAFISAFAR